MTDSDSEPAQLSFYQYESTFQFHPSLFLARSGDTSFDQSILPSGGAADVFPSSLSFRMQLLSSFPPGKSLRFFLVEVIVSFSLAGGPDARL